MALFNVCLLIMWWLLFRNVCLKRFPHSLAKLLASISWNNRSDVAQVGEGGSGGFSQNEKVEQ